jgi:hypothetical protein
MPTTHVYSVAWFTPMGHINGTVSWLDYRNNGARAGIVKNYQLRLETPGDLFTSEVAMAGEATNNFHTQMRRLAFRDLSLMRDAGFDNLVYDMLPSPNWTNAKTLRRVSNVSDADFAEPTLGYVVFLQYLAAAEAAGITVSPCASVRNVSADYPSGYTLNVAEWVAVMQGMIDNLPASPALRRIDALPLVANFGTDRASTYPPDPLVTRRDGGWLDILETVRGSGRQPYFLADYRPNRSTPEVNQDWVSDPNPARRVNALYMFAPSGPDTFMSEYQATQTNVFSVPRWWTVSPGYYRGGLAFMQPNFLRIHETYRLAIANDVEHMMWLTWNDFEEDTDCAPSPLKGRCLLDVLTYYNEWFHTRVQPAPRDQLIVMYPVRSPSSVTTPLVDFGAPYGQSPAFSPMKLHYWASVSRATSLVLPNGSKVDIPAGTTAGTAGTVTAGRQFVSVGGRATELPEIVSTGAEAHRTAGGGLEHRYVDLSHLVRG